MLVDAPPVYSTSPSERERETAVTHDSIESLTGVFISVLIRAGESELKLKNIRNLINVQQSISITTLWCACVLQDMKNTTTKHCMQEEGEH